MQERCGVGVRRKKRVPAEEGAEKQNRVRRDKKGIIQSPRKVMCKIYDALGALKWRPRREGKGRGLLGRGGRCVKEVLEMGGGKDC